jgi:hypothetical protein
VSAEIGDGERVECQDANGEWLAGVVVGGVDTTGKFPKRWVRLDTYTDEPLPWPVESIRSGER